MKNKIVKLFLIFALASSILGIVGDLRFFKSNDILGIISMLSYIPLIIVYIFSIPIIIYIFSVKIKKIILVLPFAYLGFLFVYTTKTFLTNGAGFSLAQDFIISNVFNLFIIIFGLYLFVSNKNDAQTKIS